MDKTQKELKALQKQVASLTRQLQELGATAMHEMGDDTDDYINAGKEYAGDVMDQFRDKAAETKRKVQEATQRADAYAHDNPWQLIGGAVALGVLMGVLLTKSKK
jgi:ElaB/YqjD/DUF883 family membrane-anchored ribosome-binding protein